MKYIPLTIFGLLLLAIGCGKNSPFTESYWENTNVNAGDNSGQQAQGSYSVTLAPISTNFGNLTGEAQIVVGSDGVTTSINLSELPHSLIVAQRSFTTQTCATVATTAIPPIQNTTGQFKTYTTTETAATDALIFELNTIDPQNGSSTNLQGKSLVVSGFVMNTNTFSSQAVNIMPMVCGEITLSPTTNTSGGSTGGTTGNTTGGTGTVNGGVGGSIGGTDGSVGGSIAGSVGGSIGGTAGGTIGTTLSGVVSGALAGGTTGF